MGNDIFSAVIELNKIRQQAYEIYLPIVEELCNREVSEEELSHCLDYLLDFADDASMLAYSARTAHPFQRNGAPFRFKLSKAQQVD